VTEAYLNFGLIVRLYRKVAERDC